MLFTSPLFIIFVLLFAFSIKVFPKKFSVYILFASSILFYVFNDLSHILAMFWVITASLIFDRNNKYLGIVMVLLPLFYFKYSEFLLTSIFNFDSIQTYFPSQIPPGLSFVTFTGITYILWKRKPESKSLANNIIHPVNYLLFFPQVIAGPIVRPSELLGQLKKGVSFEKLNLKIGFLLILVGLFKKFFIADLLGTLVDKSYSPDSDNAFVGLILFPWQIYFDFSAYTDLALGLGYLFGIYLPENFNSPYSANSLTEFWRRWHMTLSRFFRDYVYKPLGGNQKGDFVLYGSLFTTFTLSGLWHGANWNFILWGALNGMVVIIEKANKLDSKQSFLYFLVAQTIILFLWMIFRLPIESILDTLRLVFSSFDSANLVTNIVCFSIALVFYKTNKFDTLQTYKRLGASVPLTVSVPSTFVLLAIGMFLAGGSSDKFIYFDF